MLSAFHIALKVDTVLKGSYREGEAFAQAKRKVFHSNF